MLSYLSTDSKIRVMEKVIEKIEKDYQKINTMTVSELKKNIKKYEDLLARYDNKIKFHCGRLVKTLPPSRVNKHLAAVVAYTEIRKHIVKILRKMKVVLKIRETAKPINSRGIVKYM